MNCIIIEDQLPAQRILKKYIEDLGSLNLVGTFTDALEAMQILNSEEIDLIFLDIHLPKLSGIDFLKTLTNPPQVILTTAFQDYALESYELNVVDYLLKPFSFQRFIKAISKVKKTGDTTKAKSELEQGDSFNEVYIKSGYDHIRVKTGDIIYIVSDSDYTEIHLKDKKLLSSESLRYWEEYLSKEKFMRIHKSYIINTCKIVKVSSNQVFLEDNKAAPIGRAFKNSFTERFMK
ncbi:MAG: response regulator transcription factor [Arenibacter latericius]|nr:response regulator transcription factor [Arenibacter latericius]